MQTFYHGSPVLFQKFDLAHALEGDGKVKFGYGVYITSQYKSAAHYAGSNPNATQYYVYTVEVPDMKEDNYIAFKEPVKPSILKRAAQKMGEPIPEKFTLDGKDFRKFLAKKLTGKVDLEGEKAASAFLTSIGMDFIVWPYNWKNPALGTNMAVLDDSKVIIKSIDQVELDNKKQLIEGSQQPVTV
ncbi:MAG: hypothetical protein IKH95_10685 [Bacteroidaceae bacterium]|nr:hypothetical protein [Bacteroidaceae bacterium]